MRKKLLSLALALVMCLGLPTVAMAALGGSGSSGSTDLPSTAFSSIVSQEVANFYESVEDMTYQMTMYTVDPGTVISSPENIWIYPCEYVNNTYTRLALVAGFSYENSVTITSEQAGYWYVSREYYDEATGFHVEDCLLRVTGDAPILSFADVASDAYYADAVKWAAYMRIANGTGNGNFSPNQTCTNAQILTFIWRAEGKPEPTIANPFTNAIPDAYAKAAVWAYEKGMVSGTTFDADKPCTRAMAVTYLWQIEGSPDYSEYKTIDFSDVSASASYAKAVLWAVGWITNGTSDTTFSPEDTCTRGQIMTFLDRCKNSQ